ncbi:hypothetical protein Droror1_Dr00002301 [Drosera rotundifolia]
MWCTCYFFRNGGSTREITPCSLIRNPDSIHTPGSTTRPVGAAEVIRRLEGSMRRRIPAAKEIEEFFAVLEKEQQKQFIEKYYPLRSSLFLYVPSILYVPSMSIQ